MKKIVFILFLFGIFTGYAQPIEKLIRKAFDRGADANGIYVLENVNNISLKESDAVAYLRDKKRYVVLSSSSKKYIKFGYEEEIFDEVRFLNGAEGYKTYKHCNSKGAFYHPNNDSQAKGDMFGNVVSTTPLATRIDDVAWSGKIVNGLLDGKGIGVIVFSNGWCAIQCEFKCGIPKTKPEIIYSLPSNLNYSAQIPFPRDFEDFRKTMLIQTYDKSTDKTLRWAISENLKVYFEEVVRSIVEPEYTKAITLNNLKNMKYSGRIDAIGKLGERQVLWRQGFFNANNKEYITKTDALDIAIVKLRKFVDNYENRVSDPRGWIPKAKEIIYVYNVAQYYYAVVPPQNNPKGFRSNIGITNWYGFDNGRVKKCIDELNSVKNKIHDRQSPFYDFYNAIYPDIHAADKWLNTLLENALYEDWKRVAALQRKKEEEYHRQYMSEMCDKCKINGKETTSPEGYEPEDKHWLWGHPARSTKSGRIVFQNGIRAEWSFIYDNGKKIIDVSGGFSGKYQNEKDMWNDLLYQCKLQYCQ